MLGFIGPNGAGKSTVIKMLTGILTPTSGYCEINGRNPQKERKAYVKEIGVVFGQRTQLWWDLALRETYSVLKEIYEVDDASFKKRMDFLNEALELEPFMTSPVRTLSLGQRMRADLAASLLHSPKVLFLDEPTIGLDVVVKDSIRKAIKKISEEEGTTVILTTHDMIDIELLTKRLVMIDHGKKVYDGGLDTLKSTYGNRREVVLEVMDERELGKLQYGTFFNQSEETIKVVSERNRAHIMFDTNVVSVADIIQYTLGQIRVKDMSVKDADIEEIIRQIYRSEVVLDVKEA